MDEDEVPEAVTAEPIAVNSELLFFLFDRSRVIALDDLVKICSDFYTEDEILSARLLVDGHGCRLPKRKGADKLRATVEDIAKAVLNPNVKLPQFYAINLTRLPPVSATHCDVSALLSEIQLLRAEVRAVGQLKSELDELRAEVKTLSKMSKNAVDIGGSTRALSSNAAGPGAGLVPGGSLYSGVARQLASDTTAFRDTKRSSVGKQVVGKSTVNKNLKAAQTTRNVDVFVSRLHPNTCGAELIDWVRSVNGDIAIHDVDCIQLKSKYEDLYTSFHVAIRVDSSQLKGAVDLFMSEESWPCGVFVKRFFKRKDGTEN